MPLLFILTLIVSNKRQVWILLKNVSSLHLILLLKSLKNNLSLLQVKNLFLMKRSNNNKLNCSHLNVYSPFSSCYHKTINITSDHEILKLFIMHFNISTLFFFFKQYEKEKKRERKTSLSAQDGECAIIRQVDRDLISTLSTLSTAVMTTRSITTTRWTVTWLINFQIGFTFLCFAFSFRTSFVLYTTKRKRNWAHEEIWKQEKIYSSAVILPCQQSNYQILYDMEPLLSIRCQPRLR